jgi:hypothetical protein
MKIFSTAPEGNELAEAVGVDYIKFSISMMDGFVDWMKTTKDPSQPILAIIDMLVILAKKYPVDANLLIKKEKVQEWKNVFNDWFERCSSRIPAKFRNGIKANGDELFKELEQYGH